MVLTDERRQESQAVRQDTIRRDKELFYIDGAAGRASSVSGFVKHAVGVALHDVAGWKELLDGALHASGGPLTKKERAWADARLAPRRRQGARRRTAA